MSTKSGSTPGNVFEVKKVRELIELMKERVTVQRIGHERFLFSNRF